MIKSQDYKVLKNIKIAEDMYLLSLLAPDIASNANPGQFVHIKVPEDVSLILRRPISINYADSASGIVELVYQLVGKGTKRLSMLVEGDEVNVLGPLGRGFSINDSKNICLVGGGCGVAPLRFIAKKWPNIRFHSFLGFRNLKSAYQLDEFTRFSENIVVATDDGSLGTKGFITDLLKDSLKNNIPDLILACGPKPMLIETQKLSKEYNIPCQLSMEERMGCGTGGCLVCTCKIGNENQWEYKRVCADGPVFTAEEVLWNE